MSFLNDVTVPDETKVKTGFLDSVALPSTQERYIATLQARDYKLGQTAQRENSFGGILKGTLSSFGERVGTTAKSVLDSLMTPPSPKSLDMQSSLRQGWDTISKTIQDAAERLNTPLPNISQPKAVQLKNAAGVGQGAIGLINDAFIGITAPLNSLRGVPGIGYVADGINNVFAALGTGGSSIATNALDGLPISPESKKTLRPLVEEVGALVAQIIAGKAGADAVGKVTAKSRDILNGINSGIQTARVITEKGLPKDLQVSGESEEASVPFANKYETPKTIQAGARAKETLPVIEAGPGEYKSSVKGGFIESVPIPAGPGGKVYAPTGKVPASVSLGTPETATSKLSLDIEAKLGATLGSLPEYRTMNMKEQAEKALELITADEARAKKIAMGAERAPTGLREGSVFIAMRERALSAGDTDMLIDLSKSKLASEASILGQRVKAFDSGSSDNPVRVMQDIQKERIAAYERRAGVRIDKARTDIIKDIKTEMKKNPPTKRTWEEFIRSIECGY